MDSDQADVPASTPPEPLASGRFAGREAFEQLVRNAFVHAASEGWKEIILSDATFEDWPLRERSVVESLQAWSKPGRRMVMLATRYDELMRNHPRFVTWRKTWGHLIDCRVCRATAPADFPSAIWSPAWVMHRVEPLRSIGTCGPDRERRVQLKELLDEKIRNSAPGFASSTLGL
jgi:hypothetical protein